MVEQRTENPCVRGSIPRGTTKKPEKSGFCVLNCKIFLFYVILLGTIAQMVEQRTENPCVRGSIPRGTTKKA
jgi:hypothetical protein